MTELRRAEIGRLCVPDPYRRNRAVKPAGQNPGSEARYDFDTLIYSAIRVGRDVVMVGPKLLNFKPLLRQCVFEIDGATAKGLRVKSYYRHAVMRLPNAPDGSRLSVTFPNGSKASCPIETPDLGFLEGLNVQMTISKDNDLKWVKEQLTFHAAKCGVEAVCFIDNGSAAYSLDELADVITDCGLKKALLVSAPHSWGPTNKRPIASELYLQTSVYNVLKYQYLSQARAVLRFDIDEILIPRPSGETVFDRATAARLGFVRFVGKNRFPGAEDVPPFDYAQHSWAKPDSGPAGNNWCIDPKAPLGDMQWRCHNLEGNVFGPFQMLKGDYFYHCLGIGTGWKHEDRMRTADVLVQDAEDRAFWQDEFLPAVTRNRSLDA